MVYRDVDFIEDGTGGTADNFNGPLRQLAERDDYLKSKIDVIQRTTEATFVLEVDTSTYSAPFFGYVFSANVVLPSYIKTNDSLDLQRESFVVGMVRQTGAVKTLYLNGKISEIQTPEIVNMMVEGYALINTPVYLSSNPATAGKGTYTKGLFAVMLGVWLDDSTFLLNIDLSDIFGYTSREQLDMRAFNLTEFGTTYYDTFAGLTIVRDPLAIGENHRLRITAGVLVAGSLSTGDYIRLDNSGGITTPTNYYLPINKIQSIVLAGPNIFEIFLQYDYPDSGLAAGDNGRQVWAPEAPGVPASADTIYVIYDFSDPTTAPICDHYWEIPVAAIPNWPGVDAQEFIMVYLNGVAQNHEADLYDIMESTLKYIDVSIPPTFYGWELKTEYIAKSRLDQYIKRLIPTTNNITTTGTSEVEIAMIPEIEYILDKSGNTALKNLTVDSITGKLTAVQRTIVASLTAGPGIEVNNQSGAVKVSSITSERQSDFFTPIHATGNQYLKENGSIAYDFDATDEFYFTINIPTGNLNTKYSTIIYLAANFTEADSNYPAITGNYNLVGAGTSDDAVNPFSPILETDKMPNINSMSFSSLNTFKNSLLSGKQFCTIKLVRGTDNYKGSIYVYGVKVDFYG